MKVPGQHPPGAKCWLKDLYLRNYTTRASFKQRYTDGDTWEPRRPRLS